MDEFRALFSLFFPHFHLMVHHAQIVCFEVYRSGSTVYLVQLCVDLVDWRCSLRRLQTWVVYQVKFVATVERRSLLNVSPFLNSGICFKFIT